MSFADRMFHSVMGTKPKIIKERERINFIKELLAIYEKKKIREKDLNDFAKNIASDFFVDEIVAAKNGGEVYINSEKRISPPIDNYNEVYNTIKEKFPEASMITVRNNGRYEILYHEKGTLYNLKSAGDLSSLEVKKIVEKLGNGEEKWQES